jgi:ribosomal protein S18 acetylase RimI-like enzyme
VVRHSVDYRSGNGNGHVEVWMTVRRARPEEWAVLRELRLRALADAPDAFASKLADEAAAPEEMWRRRADGGPGLINLIAEARASQGPAQPPAGADGPTATRATTTATTTGATTGGGITCGATSVGMATVLLEPDAGDRAHLLGMWVDPGYRGHGVAMALLDHAVGWARERGAGEMILWVADHNAAARRLYERAGFVATGDRQPLPSNPPLPESKLRLDLSSRP